LLLFSSETVTVTFSFQDTIDQVTQNNEKNEVGH